MRIKRLKKSSSAIWILCSLVICSLSLSACAKPIHFATRAEYRACFELGYSNWLTEKVNSLSSSELATFDWTIVSDEHKDLISKSLKSGNSDLVAEAKKLSQDNAVAMSGGNPEPVALDMLRMARACQALDWNGKANPGPIISDR